LSPHAHQSDNNDNYNKSERETKEGKEEKEEATTTSQIRLSGKCTNVALFRVSVKNIGPTVGM
jgi:hypothetical protein